MAVTLPDEVCDALDELERQEREAAEALLAAGEDPPAGRHPRDLDGLCEALRRNNQGAAADWLATRPLTHNRALHAGRTRRSTAEDCSHEWLDDEGDQIRCEICNERRQRPRHDHDWAHLEGDGLQLRFCRDCGSAELIR